MKKILRLVSTSVLTLALVACGGNSSQQQGSTSSKQTSGSQGSSQQGQYAAVSSVAITAPQAGLTQVATSIQKVAFSATLNNGADPATVIEWYVNGTKSAQTGAAFEFTPTGAGSYSIQAKASGIASNTLTVNVTAAGFEISKIIYVDANTLEVYAPAGSIAVEGNEVAASSWYDVDNEKFILNLKNAIKQGDELKLTITSGDKVATKAYTYDTRAILGNGVNSSVAGYEYAAGGKVTLGADGAYHIVKPYADDTSYAEEPTVTINFNALNLNKKDYTVEVKVPEGAKAINKVYGTMDSDVKAITATLNVTKNTVAGAYEYTLVSEGKSATVKVIVDEAEAQIGLKHSQLSIPAYSSSATYAVGDVVIESSNYYINKTAITVAESFTSTKWTQIKLSSFANEKYYDGITYNGSFILADENGEYTITKPYASESEKVLAFDLVGKYFAKKGDNDNNYAVSLKGPTIKNASNDNVLLSGIQVNTDGEISKASTDLQDLTSVSFANSFNKTIKQAINANTPEGKYTFTVKSGSQTFNIVVNVKSPEASLDAVFDVLSVGSTTRDIEVVADAENNTYTIEKPAVTGESYSYSFGFILNNYQSAIPTEKEQSVNETEQSKKTYGYENAMLSSNNITSYDYANYAELKNVKVDAKGTTLTTASNYTAGDVFYHAFDKKIYKVKTGQSVTAGTAFTTTTEVDDVTASYTATGLYVGGNAKGDYDSTKDSGTTIGYAIFDIVKVGSDYYRFNPLVSGAGAYQYDSASSTMKPTGATGGLIKCWEKISSEDVYKEIISYNTSSAPKLTSVGTTYNKLGGAADGTGVVVLDEYSFTVSAPKNQGGSISGKAALALTSEKNAIELVSAGSFTANATKYTALDSNSNELVDQQGAAGIWDDLGISSDLTVIDKDTEVGTYSYTLKYGEFEKTITVVIKEPSAKLAVTGAYSTAFTSDNGSTGKAKGKYEVGAYFFHDTDKIYYEVLQAIDGTTTEVALTVGTNVNYYNPFGKIDTGTTGKAKGVYAVGDIFFHSTDKKYYQADSAIDGSATEVSLSGLATQITDPKRVSNLSTAEKIGKTHYNYINVGDRVIYGDDGVYNIDLELLGIKGTNKINFEVMVYDMAMPTSAKTYNYTIVKETPVQEKNSSDSATVSMATTGSIGTNGVNSFNAATGNLTAGSGSFAISDDLLVDKSGEIITGTYKYTFNFNGISKVITLNVGSSAAKLAAERVLVNGVNVTKNNGTFLYNNQLSQNGNVTIVFKAENFESDANLSKEGYSLYVMDDLAAVPAWATSTAYKIGDIVSDSGAYYKANTDHTSTGANIAAADSAKWDTISATSITTGTALKASQLLTNLAAGKKVVFDENGEFSYTLPISQLDAFASANKFTKVGVKLYMVCPNATSSDLFDIKEYSGGQGATKVTINEVKYSNGELQ